MQVIIALILLGAIAHLTSTVPEGTTPAFTSLLTVEDTTTPVPVALDRMIERPVIGSIPEECVEDLDKDLDKHRTSLCMRKLLLETANFSSSEHDMVCWPLPSSSSLRTPRKRLTDAEVLAITPETCGELPPGFIFHTIILEKHTPVLNPFLLAFTATQCCTAELWIWVPSGLGLAASDLVAGIPRQHHSRIRVLPFDESQQWLAMQGDEQFKEALRGRSGVEIMKGYMSGTMNPNKADVVRLLILHRYGGTYVDLDVLLLRDLRVAFKTWPAFVYRWSGIKIANTAVAYYGACGAPLSFEIISDLLRDYTGAASELGSIHYYNTVVANTLRRLAKNASWNGKFAVLSAILFDPLWLRLDGLEPNDLRDIMPGVRSFEAFYVQRDPPVPDDAVFFGGAPLAHHVHNSAFPNRDSKTPGSWANSLLRHHSKLSALRECS